MAVHKDCDVELGFHSGPFWVDWDKILMVCDTHRKQYDQREDLGPFNWVRNTEAEKKESDDALD